MLPYFLLGLALLAGAFLAIRWFVKAEPAQVVKALRWALVALAVSFGGKAVPYRLTYLFAPGFAMFRGQERTAFITTYSLAILVFSFKQPI